ncbi:hypothetical protein G3O08_17650, partial [Cryomorpha ignava]|nr:hypothetical protein [Cryomorpha ignava]
AYYEKPALPLRVLPENDEVRVIVVYRIELKNGKVVQGWFTPDPAEQFSNPYLAMGNNPVMYVDPDGEFIIGALIGAAISGTVGYISGKNAGLTGSNLLEYTLGSAVIGGFSGGVGTSVGAGVSASLSIGGFAGGAIAGAAGGAAGGFVGGFLGTTFNNSTFGTNHNALNGGLKGAAIGGLAGGIGGGLTRGITDMRNGYSFWDGSTVDEVIIQGGNPEALAARYNSSSIADINDEYLKIRIQDDYRITEGDFGIKNITTKTGRGYGLDQSGTYVDLKSGNSVGGYVRRFSTGTSNLHVSPKYTTAANVSFRSVAGHELIHAYHHYTIPSFSRIFSERVAYKYTYDTFMGAGQFNNAMKVYNTANTHGFWGAYPPHYQIPTPFGW